MHIEFGNLEGLNKVRQFALRLGAGVLLMAATSGIDIRSASARPAIDPPGVADGSTGNELASRISREYGVKAFTVSIPNSAWNSTELALVESGFSSLPTAIFPVNPTLTIDLSATSGVDDLAPDEPSKIIRVAASVLNDRMRQAARVDLAIGAVKTYDPIDPTTYFPGGGLKHPFVIQSRLHDEVYSILGGSYDSAEPHLKDAARDPQRAAGKRFILDEPDPETGLRGTPRLLLDIGMNDQYPRNLIPALTVIRMRGLNHFLTEVGEVFPAQAEALERFVTGSILQGQDYLNFQPVALSRP